MLLFATDAPFDLLGLYDPLIFRAVPFSIYSVVLAGFSFIITQNAENLRIYMLLRPIYDLYHITFSARISHPLTFVVV